MALSLAPPPAPLPCSAPQPPPSAPSPVATDSDGSASARPGRPSVVQARRLLSSARLTGVASGAGVEALVGPGQRSRCGAAGVGEAAQLRGGRGETPAMRRPGRGAAGRRAVGGLSGRAGTRGREWALWE